MYYQHTQGNGHITGLEYSRVGLIVETTDDSVFAHLREQGPDILVQLQLTEFHTSQDGDRRHEFTHRGNRTDCGWRKGSFTIGFQAGFAKGLAVKHVTYAISK